MSEALDWLLAVRPGPMQAYFGFLKQAGAALDPKTRALISVITKVGAQTERGFRQYLRRALREGCSADEIIDALLMAFPLLGFSKIVWAVDQIIAMGLPEFDLERLQAASAAGLDAEGPGPGDAPAQPERSTLPPPAGTAPVVAAGDVVAGGVAAVPPDAPAVWTDIGAPGDFPPDVLAHVPGPRGGCFVRRTPGGVNVFRAHCPHRHTPLSLADLDPDEGDIRCPRHGWCFDARTGAARGVAEAPLQPLPVRVAGGRLEVCWD